MLKNTCYSTRTNNMRQTRMDAIMFDNDAHACYDRIILSLAAIISRCAGMPRDAAHVLIWLLLTKMEYHVRMTYSNSRLQHNNAST
jgi:hypothetical protein